MGRGEKCFDPTCRFIFCCRFFKVWSVEPSPYLTASLADQNSMDSCMAGLTQKIERVKRYKFPLYVRLMTQISPRFDIIILGIGCYNLFCLHSSAVIASVTVILMGRPSVDVNCQHLARPHPGPCALAWRWKLKSFCVYIYGGNASLFP